MELAPKDVNYRQEEAHWRAGNDERGYKPTGHASSLSPVEGGVKRTGWN